MKIATKYIFFALGAIVLVSYFLSWRSFLLVKHNQVRAEIWGRQFHWPAIIKSCEGISAHDFYEQCFLPREKVFFQGEPFDSSSSISLLTDAALVLEIQDEADRSNNVITRLSFVKFGLITLGQMRLFEPPDLLGQYWKKYAMGSVAKMVDQLLEKIKGEIFSGKSAFEKRLFRECNDSFRPEFKEMAIDGDIQLFSKLDSRFFK